MFSVLNILFIISDLFLTYLGVDSGKRRISLACSYISLNTNFYVFLAFVDGVSIELYNYFSGLSNLDMPSFREMEIVDGYPEDDIEILKRRTEWKGNDPTKMAKVVADAKSLLDILFIISDLFLTSHDTFELFP